MIKGIVTSKTINFNVWTPIVTAALAALGITIPLEVVVGIMALGNFVLRFFTKKPLAEK